MLELDEMMEEEFGSADPEHQYLFFICEQELYAIKSLQVQEIVEYADITKVPMVQSQVLGVTNIRGNIVPVIDLMNRMGLGRSQIRERTSIIVINHTVPGQDICAGPIGMMIDEVFEVDNIDEDNIVERPLFGSKVDPRFVSYMGKYNNKYLPILNIETLLSVDELAEIGV